jgi:hypothetical protein
MSWLDWLSASVIGLRARPSRLFLLVAILCVTWGALEVDLPARVRASDNVAVDQMIPVFLRLRTLSFQDGTLSGLRDNGQTSTLCFHHKSKFCDTYRHGPPRALWSDWAP